MSLVPTMEEWFFMLYSFLIFMGIVSVATLVTYMVLQWKARRKERRKEVKA